ncbi:hypothetical protein ABE096_19955 [Robertmurraya massiliosenegalensis]
MKKTSICNEGILTIDLVTQQVTIGLLYMNFVGCSSNDSPY